MNISIDAGHNSIKAASSTKEMLIPSITSTDVVDLDITDIIGNLQSDYNEKNYLSIKFEGQKFFLGNLAREQSNLCVQNVNHEDLISYETKVLSLAAATYVSESDYINLLYNLPVTHYHEYKDKIQDMFDYKNNPVIVDFYDFEKKKYRSKGFYIRNIEVQPQGFYALMHQLLDRNGGINNQDLLHTLKVIIDIGYYSTDVIILNGMKAIKRIPQSPIPGMAEAHKIIAKELNNKFGLRKELHDIDLYTRQKAISVGGKTYTIDSLINGAYSQLARKIISEVNNLITFWPEVSNWFVCGGGGVALFEELQNQYENAELIPDAQFANCYGGLKWGARKYGKQSEVDKNQRKTTGMVGRN